MRSRARANGRRVRSALALVLVIGATVAAPGRARADEDADGDAKRACVSAHERTQRARIAGKLVEARTDAIACAQDRCPGLVRTECARLLADIESALPRVSFEVRDDGARVRDVVIAVDGVTLAEAAEGRPVALDPGLHRVRVSTADGRTVEEGIVLLEGELHRRVTVTLAARPSAGPLPKAAGAGVTPASPAGASSLAPASSEPVAPSRSAVPWPIYALSGVGVAGLGTFVVFGLRGYREEVALESSCAPACAPGSDDAMRRDYVVADVALVTGVAALAAAAVLYVTHRASDAKPHSDASASPGPAR